MPKMIYFKYRVENGYKLDRNHSSQNKLAIFGCQQIGREVYSTQTSMPITSYNKNNKTFVEALIKFTFSDVKG